MEAVDDIAAPTAVPPVVAVVVTSNAGPWLEEAISALAAQDYPNLSVLVIDAASEVDPTPRIAAVLPSAYVRRLDANPGYAAAANDVIGVVEGASHYVFLHDDAAPDTDAIRLMVEEAFRSNAGIVAPKLVEWDDPMQLLAVGASADKAGVVRPYGRHELDQEQHDAVRDVFVAPGGCTLVRADLFETLGGFDAGIELFGEDLDLSWRAQLLGARVVVAPGARVRHREAGVRGERDLEIGTTTGELPERVARLQLRHRLRAVLKNYSPVHLLRVLPQLIALTTGEAVMALFSGQRRLAGALTDAWRWNFRHRRELRSARRDAQRARALRDREVRRLQTGGSVRLSAALRGSLEAEERTFGVGAAGRQLAGAVASGGARLTVTVWLGLFVLLFFGSRHLVSGRMPAVGQFAPFPGSPLTFLRMFASGWRTSGLGSEAPQPLAFAFLGLGGVVLGGAMGLLQKVLILGMIPAGLVGVHRLTAPLGSWRARLAGVVLYAAVPLPYDAIAKGRWAALISYAAAPFVLGRLLRATGLAPFGAPAESELGQTRRARAQRARRARAATASEAVEELLGAEAGTMDAIDTEEFALALETRFWVPDLTPEREIWHPKRREVGPVGHQVVAAAILLGVVGAFVPAIAAAALLVAIGLVVGGVLVGEARASARPLVIAAGGVLGAAVLLVPWSLELVLPGGTWGGFAGLGLPASGAPSLGQLVRFGTGPFSGTPFGWALLVTAALPLVVGRRWRFTWAARLWMVAAVIWGVAWVAARGWLGVPPPPTDVLLAPAAVAMVLAAVLGLSAFENDLPAYRFGWPQVASVVAAVAAALSTLPALAGTIDGRWKAPGQDFATTLSWMPERKADGAFRVLWAGDPQVLPLDGWRLDDGLAYGSSRNGAPDATGLWPASDQGATGLMADAVQTARRGETSRLGHLLGPMGVRYVAVPMQVGPSTPPRRGVARPAPADLLAALRAQVDLKQVTSDATLVVYENVAWAPARSVLPQGAVESSRRTGPDAARTTELAGAVPALARESSSATFRGLVPSAGETYFAEAYSSRWQLRVAGTTAAHRKAFGWSNAFTVAKPGEGTLRYRTSPVRYAAILLELALWVGAIRFVVLGARRRRRSEEVV
jgi:GT2 family glycosyltransferase